MSQTSMMRLAFRAARPLRRPTQDPTTYLRACRRGISNASLKHTQMTNARHARGHPILSPLEKQNSPQSRLLSSTPARHATVVVQNPRVDEDGQEMTITISDRAAKRLKQITSAPAQRNTLTSSSSPSSPSSSHLRVTVTSGGCHGFQYLMSLEDSSKIDAEEDTIFTNDDNGSETGKAEVVMDSASLELLKGSTIDFTQELIGSQFKVVGNPRATSSCGCGTSFDIE
ncbi:uncharacterized protein Z520_03200 [Fonsecaea multimorphosa CBS 102226]|uniref:Core domain-containing protein n=1 Tax=Fonsecaea multimorphosa CBS 102226 TaxID=1442371 RepID=A0A0D2IU56_9EURO|nr:uncharacterized protein Z520_03200 [Fonsecaea multimorphosa CBS 102226]KIY00537.1 hypothetical protein Z520_03200 [Fonsecaea multimorphosa CBS 102226]OAL18933.1 hypothetical protein AYO22_10262 [Fonsecaea multimorphosa]